MTGAGALGVGVAAYLISKEIYIINNETVVAVVMGGVIYALLRKIGKPVTEYIDARNQVGLVQFSLTHTHTHTTPRHNTHTQTCTQSHT